MRRAGEILRMYMPEGGCGSIARVVCTMVIFIYEETTMKKGRNTGGRYSLLAPPSPESARSRGDEATSPQNPCSNMSGFSQVEFSRVGSTNFPLDPWKFRPGVIAFS